MAKKIELDEDFYFREATIFGIVSELPDYRLCYMLNEALSLKLKRAPADREFSSKKGTFLYSEFEFDDPEKQVTWLLTTNRKARIKQSEHSATLQLNSLSSETSAVPLVSDLKMIDFFLWYDGESSSSLDAFINENLKKLSYVRTFQKVNIESSKHIKNLLLEY
ncbi:IPExxxVDY family protein [Owenweeksia hongkongensis]|uniref:IPExxxVDY family protein n=1 Tax=Owenweeksia hongkongensis TaxID=253245 RepID=UPI003A9519F1